MFIWNLSKSSYLKNNENRLECTARKSYGSWLNLSFLWKILPFIFMINYYLKICPFLTFICDRYENVFLRLYLLKIFIYEMFIWRMILKSFYRMQHLILFKNFKLHILKINIEYFQFCLSLIFYLFL